MTCIVDTIEKELFSDKKTKPVRFFYKLPRHIRDEYTVLYPNIFSPDDAQKVRSWSSMDAYMYNISFEKFKMIKSHSADTDYFTFYAYYELLQPVIETIKSESSLAFFSACSIFG